MRRWVWMREECRAAAVAVSRCCWTLAPAPPTPSKIAAGPQVSITAKKTAGTSRVSRERDWMETQGEAGKHTAAAFPSKLFGKIKAIFLKFCVHLGAFKVNADKANNEVWFGVQLGPASVVCFLLY